MIFLPDFERDYPEICEQLRELDAVKFNLELAVISWKSLTSDNNKLAADVKTLRDENLKIGNERESLKRTNKLLQARIEKLNAQLAARPPAQGPKFVVSDDGEIDYDLLRQIASNAMPTPTNGTLGRTEHARRQAEIIQRIQASNSETQKHIQNGFEAAGLDLSDFIADLDKFGTGLFSNRKPRP